WIAWERTSVAIVCRSVISNRETCTHRGWFVRRGAKDGLVYSTGFHAEIRRNSNVRAIEALLQSTIEPYPQSCKAAQSSVRCQHPFSQQHRIPRETTTGDPAELWCHPETAHADKRNLCRRNRVEQLIDQPNVICLGALVGDHRIEVKSYAVTCFQHTPCCGDPRRGRRRAMLGMPPYRIWRQGP